jgi:hypothetical protein
VVQLIPELPSIVGLLALVVPVFAGPDSVQEDGFVGARLRAALARGSLVELEEIGTNLPERDLLAAIESPDRELCVAGIAAASSARDAWVLLPILAKRAGSPDRPIAAAAAESAAEIARDLEFATLADTDITDDELEAAAAAWLAVAEYPAYWPDVRVRGLEVSVSVARARGQRPPIYDLERFAADAEPEVRRAAYELLPGTLSNGARATASRAVISESYPEVALAAAQALCSALEPRPDEHAPPADPVLHALGQEGLARIVEMSADETLAPAGILAAARCLAADASANSRQALTRLADTGPPAIRAHTRALLKAMAP